MITITIKKTRGSRLFDPMPMPRVKRLSVKRSTLKRESEVSQFQYQITRIR